MQYICVTATRDEIRELSFATKWFADLCFTENDRIYTEPPNYRCSTSIYALMQLALNLACKNLSNYIHV